MNSVHLIGRTYGESTHTEQGRLFFTVAVPRPSTTRSSRAFDFIDCVAQGKVLREMPDPLPMTRGVAVSGRLRKESGKMVVGVHDFELLAP